MKLIASFLLVLAFTNAAMAGDYNFQCNGYAVDSKSGVISKLVLKRFSASLNEISLTASDVNAEMPEDTLKFENLSKSIVLSAKIKTNVSIVDLEGNIGPRDHSVQMFAATIETIVGLKKTTYTGSCTKIEITSCGGVFPCDGWAKWQSEP